MGIMNKLAFAGKLEVKFAETGSETTERVFSGYGAVFNNTDRASDIVAPGAFTKTLADHKASGTLPKMFFNHDAFAMPIGVWDEMDEDDHGLKVGGRFLDTSAGRDAHTAVKAGAVTGLSIGFYVTDFSIKDGIRTILEVELLEVSVVTFACNTLAKVADVKSAPGDLSDDEFLAKLDELGIDEDDANALVAKRTKSDETETDATESETVEDESADAPEGQSDEETIVDEEKQSDDVSDTPDAPDTKYYAAAIAAINTLVLELKQENHAR